MNVALYSTLAVASYMVLFPVTRWLRYLGVVDVPNSRSSHTIPVVRGGGVIMVSLIVIVATVNADVGLRWMVAPLLVLAAVSFWDDLRSVGAGWRLAVQIGVAGVSLFTLGVPHLTNSALDVVWMVGLVVWIVGYTNAFNFMDGINGLAAGQAVSTGIGTALLASSAGLGHGHPAVVLGLMVSATAVGFLPHNFPRPRVFMGDVGSASTGYLLAVAGAFAIRDGGAWCALYIGVLHGNFVLDTAVTLIRRVARGETWHAAHREHFYQRLTRSGWSHTRVTTVEMALQAVIILVLNFTIQSAAVTKLGVAFGGMTMWAACFAIAEYRFQRRQSPT